MAGNVAAGGHIKWIDGLKGIACILVFWHHFALAFLPGIHYGEIVPSHIAGGFDTGLAQSPLSVVLNGNFMVAIFCVLSGFVLSVKALQSDEKQLARMIAKRYPRLMLPVIPVGAAVYVMLRLGCFWNQQVAVLSGSPWFASYYLEPVTATKLIYAMVGGIWFQGDDSLSTAFWMLKTLFLGSFVSILLCVVVRQMKQHAVLFLCCCAAVLAAANDMLWSFALGALLAYAYIHKKDTLYNPWKGILCILAGGLLGGYPSGAAPSNAYRFLNIFPDWYNGYMLLHIAGAGLLVYGLLSLRRLPALLGSRVFLFLGKISYAVYLVHIPLLFSFSAFLFLQVRNSGTGYLRSTAVTFFASNLALVMAAYLYYRFIEKPISSLINKR